MFQTTTGFGPVMFHPYFGNNIKCHHGHSFTQSEIPYPYYRSPVNYAGLAPPNFHSRSLSFQPAPVLPPLVSKQPIYPNRNLPMVYNSQYPVLAPRLELVQFQSQQLAPTESVNGGVTQTLDYDLNMMSEYVVKSAYTSFGLDFIAARDDAKLSGACDLFKKGVLSVLNATRLPSVSIFLALEYLSQYLLKLPNGAESIGGCAINVIYQNTMVAFVLANKFNDDKTFTNRSWAEATGMDISIINNYEKEWLSTFQWKLFDGNFEKYDTYVLAYKNYCKAKVRPAALNSTYNSNCQPMALPSLFPGFLTPPQLATNLYSSPMYYDNEYHNGITQPTSSVLTPQSQWSPASSDHHFTGPGNNVNYEPSMPSRFNAWNNNFHAVHPPTMTDNWYDNRSVVY